jgi:hypothetical protein
LQVSSLGPLSMTGGSQIYSAAFSSGNVGDVRVSAAGISLDGAGGPPYSGISSFADMGTGNAGDVDVYSSGNITLLNRAFISGSSYTAGRGGNVNVSALGNLSLTNLSSIESDALSSGAAGSVSITAANISMTGSANGTTGVASDSEFPGSGPAGSVTVTTPGSLSIQNGASILSTTSSNFNAGAIKVDAGSVYINGGAVSDVITGIESNAVYAVGNAGSVNIAAAGNITIRDGGGVTSNSEFSYGNSGAVQISAQSLTVEGGAQPGQISSDMSSLNRGG